MSPIVFPLSVKVTAVELTNVLGAVLEDSGSIAMLKVFFPAALVLGEDSILVSGSIEDLKSVTVPDPIPVLFFLFFILCSNQIFRNALKMLHLLNFIDSSFQLPHLTIPFLIFALCLYRSF